jgi:hypothetical protein
VEYINNWAIMPTEHIRREYLSNAEYLQIIFSHLEKGRIHKAYKVSHLVQFPESAIARHVVSCASQRKPNPILEAWVKGEYQTFIVTIDE